MSKSVTFTFSFEGDEHLYLMQEVLRGRVRAVVEDINNLVGGELPSPLKVVESKV